jgi:hypothetical protein
VLSEYIFFIFLHRQLRPQPGVNRALLAPGQLAYPNTVKATDAEQKEADGVFAYWLLKHAKTLSLPGEWEFKQYVNIIGHGAFQPTSRETVLKYMEVCT